MRVATAKARAADVDAADALVADVDAHARKELDRLAEAKRNDALQSWLLVRGAESGGCRAIYSNGGTPETAAEITWLTTVLSASPDPDRRNVAQFLPKRHRLLQCIRR